MYMQKYTHTISSETMINVEERVDIQHFYYILTAINATLIS